MTSTLVPHHPWAGSRWFPSRLAHRSAPRGRSTTIPTRGAPPSGGRRGRGPFLAVPHQDRRQHLNRPLVEGPVVHEHLDHRPRQLAYPIGGRGTADHHVHP